VPRKPDYEQKASAHPVAGEWRVISEASGALDFLRDDPILDDYKDDPLLDQSVDGSPSGAVSVHCGGRAEAPGAGTHGAAAPASQQEGE